MVKQLSALVLVVAAFVVTYFGEFKSHDKTTNNVILSQTMTFSSTLSVDNEDNSNRDSSPLNAIEWDEDDLLYSYLLVKKFNILFPQSFLEFHKSYSFKFLNNLYRPPEPKF